MPIAPLLRATFLPIAALWLALPALGKAAATTPTYDVVSIKPHHATGDPNRVSTRISIQNDRYLGENVTLKMMIQYAYSLKIQDQIVGVTGWADSAHFDVEAKVDADTVATLKKLPEKESQQQRRLMMQAMLADRFQLKFHTEKKELPIFVLVVAKGGIKFKEADPNEEHAGRTNAGSQFMTATAIPMPDLCAFLAGRLHRQVDDRTGLPGKYDFTLKWAPDELAGQPDAAADSGPSIFTALEEQLGLKLDSAKGLVDTIVVDHVDQPTDN